MEDFSFENKLEELECIQSSFPLSEALLREIFVEGLFTQEEVQKLYAEIGISISDRTKALDQYKGIKIELFSTNLAIQPGFPELERIVFLNILNNPIINRFINDDYKDNKEEGWLQLFHIIHYIHYEECNLLAREASKILKNLFEINCEDGLDLSAVQKHILERAGSIKRLGNFHNRDRTVYINDRQPESGEILAYLLIHQEIKSQVATLLHELCHAIQRRYSPDLKKLEPLVESQAEIFCLFLRKRLSLKTLSENISQDYKLDVNQVLEAVVNIDTLYLLGFSTDQIARVISEAEWDDKSGTFPALEMKIEMEKRKRGLDDFDIQALRDQSRIDQRIEIAKAVKIGQEVLLENIKENKRWSVQNYKKARLDEHSDNRIEKEIRYFIFKAERWIRKNF